ncbi:predicted protein [Histoplasma capsulatum G186AR]|uniref:Uncharacterized protein n=1 Tax=Ajellomyces capsulatus (strain G186AR / H82 / ATCC MYA-2454 / RMSCC 2432) TaxID=447093 RepID=C0NZN8_AJECG|nr:uncharacterized protein HCBG_08618 [Histoplasma capsulatum G186AR]EEH03286.1 predicted protein [Histoplasma capsulatum G186AR]
MECVAVAAQLQRKTPAQNSSAVSTAVPVPYPTPPSKRREDVEISSAQTDQRAAARRGDWPDQGSRRRGPRGRTRDPWAAKPRECCAKTFHGLGVGRAQTSRIRAALPFWDACGMATLRRVRGGGCAAPLFSVLF